MMEPLLAKKKKGRKESSLPWSSILNSFCRRWGPEEARMEPGRSPRLGEPGGEPQLLFPQTQQGPSQAERRRWPGAGGQLP